MGNCVVISHITILKTITWRCTLTKWKKKLEKRNICDVRNNGTNPEVKGRSSDL